MTLHDGYKYARKFFTVKNSSSYDSVVRYATFGRDAMWKNEISKLVHDCPCILDLASGTGILASRIQNGDTNIQVSCLDLTFEYLQIAKNKSSKPFLVNATAELLPYRDEFFDSIVSSYLAKYVNIESVVNECWRTLKHEGIIIFHDFTYPSNNLMKNIWKMYFLILRLTGKLIEPWAAVFKDLDKLITATSTWPEQVIKSLKGSGFKEIRCRYYTSGTSAIVVGRKP
ncbi:MAG TPA: class I SAM-dependent methyltransferase [Nitrososphaeraceae archaeon]|nr:class I SAM-dependent methyltransferase [Nitrososphaeraceae archaeon]